MVGGPVGEGGPQRRPAEVGERELLDGHAGAVGQPPADALEVPPVGGHRVGRRLADREVVQVAVDQRGRGGALPRSGRVPVGRRGAARGSGRAAGSGTWGDGPGRLGGRTRVRRRSWPSLCAPMEQFDLIVVGTGSGNAIPEALGDGASRCRTGRVRGHLPQPGLHPLQDVRLRRRPGRRGRDVVAARRRPPGRRASTGPPSSSGSSAASTPSPRAGATTAATAAPTSPCSPGTRTFVAAQVLEVGGRQHHRPPDPPRRRRHGRSSADLPGLARGALPHLRHGHARRRAARAAWSSSAGATSPPSWATCSARWAARSPSCCAARSCCGRRTPRSACAATEAYSQRFRVADQRRRRRPWARRTVASRSPASPTGGGSRR